MSTSADSRAFTPKQRMLNAYRGVRSDRLAVAPEFWCYYPARLMGVDMLRFQREVPFHLALKKAFETFDCEGWGVAGVSIPNPLVEWRSEEHWDSEGRLEVRHAARTPHGELTGRQLYPRDEPSWTTERLMKDFDRDLPAYEALSLADPSGMDVAPLVRAWEEVGEAYLLEAWLGVPFFDYVAEAREGGGAVAVFDFLEHEERLLALRERYVEHLVKKAEAICSKTPVESLVMGCSWSNNSLIGPRMWRRWDKPVIAAAAEAVHKAGRLIHVHFHGKCMESVADFAEMGIDCVCPFERPPGGDVAGLEGLKEVARRLNGRTTMNGNLHTVETLIRGTPEDVRREVREVWEAFRHTPRVIIGTGDQVGRETPEENLRAMIDEGKKLGDSSRVPRPA